jgi:hypothetical protein
VALSLNQGCKRTGRQTHEEECERFFISLPDFIMKEENASAQLPPVILAASSLSKKHFAAVRQAVIARLNGCGIGFLIVLRNRKTKKRNALNSISALYNHRVPNNSAEGGFMEGNYFRLKLPALLK